MLASAAPCCTVLHMRVTFSVEDPVGEQLEAAAAADKRSVSSFVALLIEREFAAKNAAASVAQAAAAAAEIVGPDRVLTALKGLKEDAYAGAGGDK